MSRSRSSTSFRHFLMASISRARKNKHVGDERSKDLTDELSRIHIRVERTLLEISREADESDSADRDHEIIDKLEQTVDILSDEMMQLAAIYHRRSDISAITHFIDEEREVIHESMYGDKSETGHTKTLDARIIELHSLMASERRRLKTSRRAEQIKFWASIIIALTSLSVSAYALFVG